MITWLLRNIFWALDNIARWLIHLFYSLINQIASATLFQDFIYDFMGRIYAFLTIFMLFKLSISVVNYILNPDQFADKTKGFGKLIQNVIIVIALIIFVPTIFDWGYKLQCLILNSNVLNSVITGQPNTMDGIELENLCLNNSESCKIDEKGKDEIDRAANMITYSIMEGFVFGKENDADDFSTNSVSGGGASATKNGKSCSDYAKEGNYAEASDCLFHYSTMTNTKNNAYLFLISTACLGFVAYVFLVFTIDISIRTVKLSFLQLVAPIPIISRLDPNSGKSGMFSKWVKECTSTYLSLFIRLGAVFLAIALIKPLLDKDSFCANNAFVKIFLILGVLAFAKQLPQLIEKLTGFKMESGGLNLKKKLGQVPGLGRATAGAIGLGGGLAANAIAARKSGDTFGQGLRSALAGAGSGAFRGLTSKEKNAWKAGQGAIKGAVDARNLRTQRQTTGYTLGRRFEAGVDTFAGLDPMKKFEGQLKAYEDLEKQAGAILSRANGEMIKYEKYTDINGDKQDVKFADMNGNTITMAQFKEAKEKLGILRNTTISRSDYMNNDGVFDQDAYDDAIERHASTVNQLQTYVGKTEKLAEQAFVDNVMAGIIDDVQTKEMFKGLNQTFETYEKQGIHVPSDENGNPIVTKATSGAGVKNIKDKYADERSTVINSADYQQAMANKKQK